MSAVDLGFIEPTEQAQFLWNIHFPSKVGGRPAWLDLKSIPSPDELKCDHCQDQLTFLLQLYASLDQPESFHRTIYLFVCPNETCNKPNDNSNFRVFRNQIPRRNDYYDYHPVPEDAKKIDEAQPKFKLCTVCGCRGPFNCAKCKSVSYCCKSHQKIDWKAGHKEQCGQDGGTGTMSGSLVQFPEFEIVLEPEEKETHEPVQLEKELQALKEYETDEKASLHNVPDSELSKYAVEEEDKFFAKFRKRISKEPEQVLRYDREGQVLWMAEANRLEALPKCTSCNGDRVFEFQVMPQLLNSLKSETLDWGILAVYTCKDSCGADGKYIREFLHRQDIVTDSYVQGKEEQEEDSE